MTDAVPFAASLSPLPSHEGPVPWPVPEWPTGGLPDRVDLDALMAEAFDPAGPLHQTYAVVVVHRGRLVFERYGGLLPQWDKPGKPVVGETPLLSWSMAKSMLHAIVGMLVAEGRLVLDAPAPVPLWQSPGDPRGEITLQQLLDMRDGLDFAEEYEDPEASDVLQMLFGRGRADMATFAADRPLAGPPGTRFNYSSGTSNIISGIVARTVGPGDRYRRFLADRLFDPLGMTSATVTLDDAGAWVAASYVYATARDYARFGLLYLRDGVWAGRRLLPAGWVDEGADPVRWTRTAGTSTARTGGRGRTPSAPSGPPATRGSTSTSARRSIWSWSVWDGPMRSTPTTSSAGGPGSSAPSIPEAADPRPAGGRSAVGEVQDGKAAKIR